MDEKLDIEAITKACQEATPPPWRCVYDGSSTWIGSEDDPQGKSYIVAYSANWMETGNESANAKFVANARQWVPALVKRVKWLTSLLENMRNRDGCFCDAFRSSPPIHTPDCEAIRCALGK